jgi:hypothetical protein
MGRGGESFERRQRERAKKAKASAKREQRLQKSTSEEEETPGAAPVVDEAAVIEQLGKLHQAFEDKSISLDDFEDARGELLAKLHVT